MEPERLTAVEAAEAIAAGRLTAEALMRACLDRIERREPEVGAWKHIDPERALAAAHAADRADRKGVLHGIPVGIKDIIATADMPTTCNSPIYEGFRPSLDAACVALLRLSGAIVLGKTETTEFAYIKPARTRNPHDLSRTPGGSSSGSAAAVADFMVPIALATQTGGSTIRPASFCGIWAMKPSFHAVSTEGVRPFARSFDTIGWYGRGLEDLALVARALGIRGVDKAAAPTRPRIGLVRTADWESAAPEMRAVVEEAASRLSAAGFPVCEVALPADIERVDADHDVINAREAARAFRVEKAAHRDMLSPDLAALVDKGDEIDASAEWQARAHLAKAREIMAALFAGFDALLTPSAPGPAPVGLASTGSNVFNRRWTALHLPCISLPGFSGPDGMPLGIQLVGRWMKDSALLDVARAVAPHLSAAG